MTTQEVLNPKATILPDETSYNDKDRLNDLLISIKHLAGIYSLACQEASNMTLYDDLVKLSTEISLLQRKTYDLMFEKGWYKLEKEKAEKIDQKNKTFTSMQTQL